MEKQNKVYFSVLQKLSVYSPFFAKVLLDKAIEKSGKTKENVTAIELFEILQTKLGPELGKGKSSYASPLLAGAGMFITNTEENIIYMNPIAKKLLGQLSKGQSSNSSFEILLKKGFVKRIVDSHEVEVTEIKCLISEKTFNVSISPNYNELGVIMGTSTVFQDITLVAQLESEVLIQNQKLKEEVENRKKIEKELLENQEMLVMSGRLASLGEMAGGIAHEINNPLTQIKIGIELLKRLSKKDEVNNGKWSKILNSIDSASLRTNEVVESMKRLMHKNSSEEKNTEMFKFKELLDEVLTISNQKLAHKNINFLSDIDEEITISGDKGEIGQVILNLFNNSIDAIEENEEKWIKISTKTDSENDTIIFKDSGNGIEEKIRNKIFDPFFTTKSIGKGTGIGLGISKKIIQNHKGSLSVDKTDPNTCFVIKFNKSDKARA